VCRGRPYRLMCRSLSVDAVHDLDRNSGSRIPIFRNPLLAWKTCGLPQIPKFLDRRALRRRQSGNCAIFAEKRGGMSGEQVNVFRIIVAAVYAPSSPRTSNAFGSPHRMDVHVAKFPSPCPARGICYFFVKVADNSSEPRGTSCRCRQASSKSPQLFARFQQTTRFGGNR